MRHITPEAARAPLHEEYQREHPTGYGYTQYVAHYNAWAAKMVGNRLHLHARS